jgi:hypothetical protein
VKARPCCVILVFVSAALSAQTAERTVPTRLFGITLGATYDVGDGPNNLGDLPVLKYTGSRTFLGHGVHYYFKPKSENKAFPYIEKRTKPDDQFFETSFRLYLFPAIPPNVKTIQQLDKLKLKWEVATIEWSDTATSKEDAYYWAADLCSTFEMDIGAKPSVLDNLDMKSHSCSWTSGDREFSVRNLQAMKIVELTYKHAVVERKDKAVEARLRKLRVNEIRPY